MEVCHGQICRENKSAETLDALKRDVTEIPGANIKPYKYCMSNCSNGPNVLVGNTIFERVGADEHDPNRAEIVNIVTVYIRGVNKERE